MFDDGSPIYRQIAERIRAEVLTGVLAPDDQVMSTTQYAAFYRINPATAAKAFACLVEEGILYKRRGVGMFVRPDAAAVLRRQRRQDFFSRVVDPMVTEAQSLGIPLEEIITWIRRSTSASGTDCEGQIVPSGTPDGTARRDRDGNE